MIYLSYADEDKPFAQQFYRVFAPTGIPMWSRMDIAPGNDWKDAIKAHLQHATLFVPLLSADWFSDNVANKEFLVAREYLSVAGIYLRPCYWEGLGNVPLFPTSGKPITTYSNRDVAWQEVQRELLTIAQR